MFSFSYRLLLKLVEWISMLGIALIVCFTAFEVIMRQVMGTPTIWTNEITSYLLVWLGMLGIVYAYDQGSHVSVDLVFRRLSSRGQAWAEVVTSALMLGFALLITIYSYDYWWMAHSRDWRHTGTLDFPMTYTRVAIPAVGAILSLQVLISLVKSLLGIFGRAQNSQASEGSR
ncbi:MAG: TRAP transporter small permease [Desulfarculaceae bacterium]